MITTTKKALVLALVAGTAQLSHGADTVAEALKETTVGGAFNLRYEDVDVDTSDSDGATLRSRFTLTTGTLGNFSAVVTIEDVRDILGVDDEGGLIPDPEVTEVDEGYIQYKADGVTAKLGRQVITLDNHRYVGHVGWRQDRQTFDAARVQYSVTKEFMLDATYIYQRNRIFAETADAKSSDFVLNGSYMTPIGKLVGYAYLLDDKARDEQSDTFGLRFTGSTSGDTSFLYSAEFATQSIEDSGADFDTDYMLLEGGVKASGVTAKIGYEVLGSDGGDASFTTPLATLHAFNGWNDIFLGGGFNPTALPAGLVDTYVTVGGAIKGFSLLANYHMYEPEDGSGDYGSEWGAQVTTKLDGGVTFGLKYSSYSEDGFATDTSKLWTWLGYSF